MFVRNVAQFSLSIIPFHSFERLDLFRAKQSELELDASPKRRTNVFRKQCPKTVLESIEECEENSGCLSVFNRATTFLKHFLKIYIYALFKRFNALFQFLLTEQTLARESDPSHCLH